MVDHFLWGVEQRIKKSIGKLSIGNLLDKVKYPGGLLPEKLWDSFFFGMGTRSDHSRLECLKPNSYFQNGPRKSFSEIDKVFHIAPVFPDNAWPVMDLVQEFHWFWDWDRFVLAIHVL